MSSIVRECVAILVAWALIVSPSFAAVGTPTHEGIGILRVGNLLSIDEERAYKIVEKRVERYLRGQPELSERVKLLKSSLAVEQVRVQSDRARLSSLSDQLIRKSTGTERFPKSNEEILQDLRATRQRLARFPRFGPSVQRSLVAEGLYQWGKQNKTLFESSVVRAANLHPAGRIESLPTWDWDSLDTHLISFEEEVKDVTSKVRRVCSLTLSVSPNNSVVSLNGFGVGRKRHFSLAAGTSYLVVAEADGFESFRGRMDCTRQQSRRFIVHLKEKTSDWQDHKASLDRISEDHAVRSLLLIDTSESDFRLFLYTPGISLDEVPLSQQIRVASVLEDPSVKKLPVMTDAFQSLLVRHQGQLTKTLSPSSQPKLSPLASRDTNQTIIEVTPPAQKRWYQSWVFWAVAGSVATGAIYVLSRRDNHSVGTQSTGIRVEW